MKTKPEHISQEDWDDANIPELTDDELARMRPANEVLYELLPKEAAAAMLRPKKTGRPLGSGRKRATTVRFDTDVLTAFKSTGKGWQTRMNNALRDWLEERRR